MNEKKCRNRWGTVEIRGGIGLRKAATKGFWG